MLFFTVQYTSLYQPSQQTIIDEEAVRDWDLVPYSMLPYSHLLLVSFCSRRCWASTTKPAFIMVEQGLSSAEGNASTLGNDVGQVSCGLYVCDFSSVRYIYAWIILCSLLDASFTISLSSSVTGFSSTIGSWAIWLILRLNLFFSCRNHSNWANNHWRNPSSWWPREQGDRDVLNTNSEDQNKMKKLGWRSVVEWFVTLVALSLLTTSLMKTLTSS